MSKVPNPDLLAVRWTIGDVRLRGFEMLRLSITCAFHLFGPSTKYLVCVNSLPLAEARRRTGPLPLEVEWRQVTRADVPQVLRANLDEGLIEGMGWKLVPLRTYPERYELAIDNDCILWDLPEAMRNWLQSADGTLLAQDVDRCLGSFDAVCPPGALNAGIRGLAPGKDLELPLQEVLVEAAAKLGGKLQLTAEIEEQGLQVAAVCRLHPPLLVTQREISICSPFWPRSPELGTCGAHFVGMNAPHLPWNYYDSPADEWLEDHWRRHRPELYRRAEIGIT
ncbi:MAG TPA: hypothetical protein VFN53_04685 [Acidobacteriaceae bacterium]|nr:hypothetical protein [Acidobacteriaceae bacterium]